MEKILIIETAFLGDAVISLALAEAIRIHFPLASISILVRPESASLMKYAPSITNVICYDKYGEEGGMQGVKVKAKELNEYCFDTVFCLHNSKRTAALLQRLTIPMKVGFTSAKHIRSQLNHIVEEMPIWRVQRVQTLLSPFIKNSDTAHLPLFQLPDSLLPAAIMQLSEYIAIAPGSVWDTKQWGAGKYADLIRGLIVKGHNVVLVGSKTDRVVADVIVSLIGKNDSLISLAGETSVEEAATIIAQSVLLITNDSAPVHIALATGVHSFIMLGPTVREFGFVPPTEHATVFEDVGLWCRPCSSHGSRTCPVYTHDCMKNIDANIVLERALSYLELKKEGVLR